MTNMKLWDDCNEPITGQDALFDFLSRRDDEPRDARECARLYLRSERRHDFAARILTGVIRWEDRTTLRTPRRIVDQAQTSLLDLRRSCSSLGAVIVDTPQGSTRIEIPNEEWEAAVRRARVGAVVDFAHGNDAGMGQLLKLLIRALAGVELPQWEREWLESSVAHRSASTWEFEGE